eukprot:CAMPEP_0119104482 /NCGR_PEP_ID=MMETSP1180-20130426/2684_1 /TAXON_ID=3052 ORGANISM="Chlamydomonas cf sp, Strain CCMP681" /NCGR_SAMPLE_ID=MMETSP1180 /ASSEMBLY_ACC=CAM_ASM_000741 /LENGTH=212 /DNA_ID=CAMNT_0007089253 /DNA_START=152 /DNA_END=790 /DNA_ORIENTATION=-
MAAASQDMETEVAKYELNGTTVAYKRYLTVLDRKITVTCKKTGEVQAVPYDVVGHPQCDFQSASCLAYHSPKNGEGPQFTLIREFQQGPGRVMYSVVSGGFDPRKHTNIAECVRAELSEEALLMGGELVALQPPGHPGMFEVKWCANRTFSFLVIDPEVDPAPKAQDMEEYIEVVRVSLTQLRELMDTGELVMPQYLTCKLALEHLTARGLV